jgi:hypothetical protein
MDDEYVRNILTMSNNESIISRNLYFTKSKKSFQLNPGLVNKINQTSIPMKLQNWSYTGAIAIDRDRFDRVMDKIGKGLYFNDFNKTWSTELNIYSPNVFFKKYFSNPHEKLFRKVYKEFAWGKSKGDNIEVFTYKWGNDIQGNIILRLRFYTNFIVYVFPHFKIV